MLGKLGRLGNQMFQYATLYSIAKKNGYEYGIPFDAKSQNEYENMCLKECFKNISAKNCKMFMPKTRVQETSNLFSFDLMKIEDNVDLFGYFQTEKYFKDYRNDILHEFAFKEEIKNKVTDIRKNYDSELISIHMRFGDYDLLPDVYPKPSKQYYENALDILPKDAKIILFSDEPHKAEEFFNSLEKKFTNIKGLNKYEDMCFMSMCDYHIIANSSFSWWGSWLSNSKKTIAPKQWYGNSPNAPKSWDDIYCEKWEILE